MKEKFKKGDYVKCIKECGSVELPIKVGDIVEIIDVFSNSINVTKGGKNSLGSSIEYFTLVNKGNIINNYELY